MVEVGQGLFIIDTDGKPSDGGGSVLEEETSPPPASTPEPAPSATEAPTRKPATPPPPPAAKPAAPPPPSLSGTGNRTENRVKMSRMRQRVATRLKEAQNTAAMLTTFQEVDMGYLMELRSRHKDAFLEKHGVKLGFMSAFLKASTAALQEIPAVNAFIDDATKEIVYRNYCDISVAVASPNGLVVPVLRNTEEMSFADVEKNIMNYAKKAKEGSLALEDMAGGTFTISNGGIAAKSSCKPLPPYLATRCLATKRARTL